MARKRDQFDRGSKWLIAHHGGAVLRLAKVRPVRAWKAVQPEVVQPRHLPDGLLEVYLQRRKTPDWFLIEIATYPEARLLRQVRRGMSLVYLDRDVLPEVITVILRPKGQFQVGGSQTLRSRLGCTQWQINWRVVELWKLPAEELLALDDVGLIPWVPLSHFDVPAESMLEQCRERIDAQTSGDERANLLAVTQVMSRLRYNDLDVFTLLGGRQTMIESPLIGELWIERLQKALLHLLEGKFGKTPPDLVSQIRACNDDDKLEAMMLAAATCANLKAFRKQLPS